MDDRIAAIREACDQFRKAFELKLSFDEKYWLDVMEIAARDWVDLLDSDALIIRRDENGEWPYEVRKAFMESMVPFREVDGWLTPRGMDRALDALASSQGVEP